MYRLMRCCNSSAVVEGGEKGRKEDDISNKTRLLHVKSRQEQQSPLDIIILFPYNQFFHVPDLWRLDRRRSVHPRSYPHAPVDEDQGLLAQGRIRVRVSAAMPEAFEHSSKVPL